MTAENIERFATLSLPVESELGRCTMSVGEILSLVPGSLIGCPVLWDRRWIFTSVEPGSARGKL